MRELNEHTATLNEHTARFDRVEGLLAQILERLPQNSATHQTRICWSESRQSWRYIRGMCISQPALLSH